MPKEDTQFTSDNQPENRGSKKGNKKLKTLIRGVLAEKTEKNGLKQTKDILMVSAIVDKAMDGDVSAFRALGDRLEGQPKQEIEQTGGNTVIINRPPPRKKPKRKKKED